jgi:8-oxo-dGTP pyrophosphatase MutT (NUDIX family)
MAAQRELYEETGLSSCQWYQYPFLTTDAITYNTTTNNTTNPTTTTQVQFHYLIAQCFARAADGLPSVTPNDDALDAQWFTVSHLQAMQKEKTISEFVVQVVERAEELSLNGLLLL